MTMKPIMEGWRSHLREGAGSGRGVQLEWAIVYWALKMSGREDELQMRVERRPELRNYGEGEMRDAAISAVEAAMAAGAPIGEAYHSDEQGIAGNPEPKTDLMFGSHRVSVKMEGGIQLSSAEGRNTALMFRTVMDELLADPEFREDLKQDVLLDIIDRIENTPTKMIDPKNLGKAMARRPRQALQMMADGKLLDENNWKVWEAQNKQSIISDMVSYLDGSQEFKYRLIEEAMTGKRAFGADDLATADYIMTPTYYGPLDQAYIMKTMQVTKIQVRAKSRSGITSAAFRFDVASASKTAAIQLADEEDTDPLEEGMLSDFLAGARDKLSGLISKWWINFKNYTKNWFTNNIRSVIMKTLSEIEISFE